MQESKHNGSIAFWKFMFSMMILVLHFGTRINNELIPTGHIRFEGGSIAVDFFFMVSGYLLYTKSKKSKFEDSTIGRQTKDYVLKRFLKLIPFVVFPYIINLVIMIIEGKEFYQIVNSVFYLTMFTPNSTGLSYIYPDGLTWYIGVLLIWSTILYPIISKDKNKYLFI